MPDFLSADHSTTSEKNTVSARQIAFFAAFILPVYKLLEAPALLAQYAKGDLLLPATIQFLFQFGAICALLFVASRSDKPLLQRLEETCGKRSAIFYLSYAAYFLFAAVLPLLDLEKFVYAAFYDTAPTIFSFAAFFVLSAYVSVKGLRSVGRSADLSAFLFFIPFFALLVMSVAEADFKSLLPILQEDFSATLTAVQRTTPHFADAALLLPLLGNFSYRKGDGKKITGGYALGSVFTLLFLAIFYGVFSTVAHREHYAFIKIAQYFPVLSIVGRIDLIFVYALCIVLFFYTAFPLQFATEFSARVFGAKTKFPFAAAYSLLAFLFVLFCNKYYNAIYQLFCGYLFPVCVLFCNAAPILFLLIKEKRKGSISHADKK